MKRLGLIVLVVSGSVMGATAQQTPAESWPYWAISKDVHKARFRNVESLPVSIGTGNSDWIISKAVQRNKVTPAQPRGTVQMTGYPTWTISKGVARFNAERSKRR